ncbi:hypothetical protein FN846DRAFT_903554 [Sphaerosporella brunnea]|uniref:Transmembrane protein n=1 Tax=Sphaerosporella brunnea TaxID=1250544 RepID=A0A5J5F740_9PEZI|nr:hypothetical protein FN846DRAFT_903554 [Sphaerosporella brunnea]
MLLSFLRRFKRSNTVIHRLEQHEDMIVTITGLILAVLSLPFIVYAGDRTVGRLPRPGFVRSLSESMVGRLKRRDSDLDETTRSVRNTSATPTPTLERTQTDAGRVGRVDTGFSISSQETYFRGVTLEKMGVD